ncbi:MAG: uncharacterized protein JWR08_2519 [Enterovirga sp.]|jgi:hypothetical protein|nr:uncharacterized protein [Enterovirga sp.]
MSLTAEMPARDADAPATPALATRECGSCTLCCKTMSVWEIDKPNGVWCRHVKSNRMCAIYETRPQSCRSFDCLWLRGVGPEGMRPDKSRVIMVEAEEKEGGPKGFAVVLDPTRPLAWQEPTVRAFLETVRDRYGVIGMALGTRKRVFHAGQPLQTP